MHSWAFSLRKSTAPIQVFAAKSLLSRSLFIKSNSSLLGSSISSDRRYYKNEGDSSFLESLLRSVLMGVVVVGSSIGLYSGSSFCRRDSFVSYADSGSQRREPENKPSFLFKDTYRRKVFLYEKRIRIRSPPEKGHIKGSAVVPFPGISRMLQFRKNINQCVTKMRLEISMHTESIHLESNVETGIDKQEFKRVMSLMRSQNRQGASHRDGKRIGLKVSGYVENGGLLEYFFGKDGNQRLEHDKFVKFLRDLHDEMLRLEFAHYDFKSQGTIHAKDFVLSMVASSNMRFINKFLDQVDELNNEPSLRDLRVTFKEFKNFALLRKKLEPFLMALFSYGKVNGLLSKQDFKRAAEQVCGISLTDKVIDLVFYMFDANRDGSLSSDEFLRVLERRETDILQPRERGFAGLISCWLDCTKNCSSKKLFWSTGDQVKTYN